MINVPLLTYLSRCSEPFGAPKMQRPHGGRNTRMRASIQVKFPAKPATTIWNLSPLSFCRITQDDSSRPELEAFGWFRDEFGGGGFDPACVAIGQVDVPPIPPRLAKGELNARL